MAVSEEVLAGLRSQVGATLQHELGQVSALTIRRYARATGESDPVCTDPVQARAAGYADVVAPPNLLVGIVGWGDGGAESDLRVDGTEIGEHLPGIPASGVRVMGGGEEMHFHTPVVAGTVVRQEMQLLAVDAKQTKDGTMAVLRYRVQFTDDAGTPLLTSMRTVLLR